MRIGLEQRVAPVGVAFLLLGQKGFLTYRVRPYGASLIRNHIQDVGNCFQPCVIFFIGIDDQPRSGLGIGGFEHFILIERVFIP